MKKEEYKLGLPVRVKWSTGKPKIDTRKAGTTLDGAPWNGGDCNCDLRCRVLWSDGKITTVHIQRLEILPVFAPLVRGGKEAFKDADKPRSREV